MRASVCRRAAISRGQRHACPLIDKLAEYAALSDQLPYPSQVTLATEIGVSERQIRRWTIALELIGVIQVFRSNPHKHSDGTFTRCTHRYLLCDRRARYAAATCPVPRRRPKAPDSAEPSPTGHPCPVTPTTGYESPGVAVKADDPPGAVSEKSVETTDSQPESQTEPTSRAEALQNIRRMKSLFDN